MFAASAILVFGAPARAVRAQAGAPAGSAPARQTQTPDEPGSGTAVPVDPLTGRPVPVDPITGKPVPVDPVTGRPAGDGGDAATGTAARSALSTSRVFASEAGLILTPVKTARVKDFEMVVGRIHEALARSADPVRQQQAVGWKVYRAAEPGPGGSVLFVFLMSPAVKGADYTIGKILLEAFPLEEVQEIFDVYTQTFAGPQSLLSLRALDDFSLPAKPRPPDRK